MNLVDIIALAKQGYKPSDIKELLAMAEPEPAQAKVQPTEPEQSTEPQPQPESVKEDQTPTAPRESAQTGNEVIEELKATIKDLQQQNIKQDLSENIPDPQEELNSLVKAYM